MRLRESGWSDLHIRGSQEVHGGQVESDQPASFLEQSSGAGIPVGLALHSGGDVQSREDKERHRSVNSASSPSQTAAGLWVRDHPPSGDTKTSTCTACLGVGKTWQSHDTEPECREIPGKCRPTKTNEAHPAVPPSAVPPASVESQLPRSVPMDISCAGASLTQVLDNKQAATLPSTVSGPQQTQMSRVGAASITISEQHTGSCADPSLTRTTSNQVGRHCLTAPGAHVINANDHVNSWAAWRTDEVCPGRGCGDEECRQQRRRRFRRTRWFPIRFHNEGWAHDRAWRTGARICLVETCPWVFADGGPPRGCPLSSSPAVGLP